VSDTVGVGIDVVDVARLASALRRRPGLGERVFTAHERATTATGERAVQRLAARFAAKEATMKALGVGLGAFPLREVEVLTGEDGRPSLKLHGRAGARATDLGVVALSVSLSHTATLATAVVVADRAACSPS
jgi:holo-[acyl-carrier protein] synthase